MTMLSRVYRGTTDFDFVGNRRRWFTISGVLILLSLLSLGFRGLNLGVDFQGGTIVEAENPAGASVGEVRDALAAIGQAGGRVQLVGGGDGIRIQTEELNAEDLSRLIALVSEVSGTPEAGVNSQTVGPTFGEQVAESARNALIIFLVLVAVFISLVFEWKMALAGLAALVHDLILTAGIYSIVGLEVTPATVIAVLTILGYSLYDTVVVFDKVRENIEDSQQKSTVSGIVNTSMNEVFMRSVNTSLTSLLPVGSLLFVGSFLLGAATLREFALALFVGIAAGTYSSIFFASPMLAMWKEREPEWQRMRVRVQRKEASPASPSKPGPSPVRKVKARAARATDETEPDSPEPTDAALPDQRPASGATPRPPKRRGKRRR